MRYVKPGEAGSVVQVAPRSESFIGGRWLAPTNSAYSTNLSPATAQPICLVPKSSAEDFGLALDAAHTAKDAWAERSLTEPAPVRRGRGDGPVRFLPPGPFVLSRVGRAPVAGGRSPHDASAKRTKAGGGE
jgi:hypothetical protein